MGTVAPTARFSKTSRMTSAGRVTGSAVPVVSAGSPSHVAARMLRLLVSLLIALAMIQAPAAMAHTAVGPATAHDASASTADHGRPCSDGQTSEDGRAAVAASCTSSCAALPATGPLHIARAQRLIGSPAPAGAQVLVGIHPEGETPPPRITPEI